MRIGISGTHGTGKTTLAEALSAHLPGHLTADEPYYLLEDEGHEFAFPPSPDDYRALLARALQSLSAQPQHPASSSTGHRSITSPTWPRPASTPSAKPIPGRSGPPWPAWTCSSSPSSPPRPSGCCRPELPELREAMNDALLDLVYADPLDAWAEVPLLELDGPLENRLPAILAALGR